MSRVRLLVTEAWSSIRQNASTTVAATMTVLIGMFLLGVFIALGTWVLSWSNHVKKELQVKVYFVSGATTAQEVFTGQKLRSLDHVKRVVFVSKAQAESQMRKEFPDLY
ncbi:MAG TPA: permease-like cell division protein FtsX, partial [Gaiellaceae bacterium]|nr:permease-like cell division protein FtsX [Gaiellaceae bacterium]